jgi:hypothetical protein
MPITHIALSNTFRFWFNKTNEIIDKLNDGVASDGGTAYGAFIYGNAANTSLSVTGALYVNNTSITANANTTFNSNTVFSTNANILNIAAQTTLLQSPLGTFINVSPFTVNATSTFNGAVIISNTVTLTGSTLNVASNAFFANVDVSGLLNVRQIYYGKNGALLVPAALTSPQYNDYQPTGMDDASIINLNPSIDTILSGLSAPTNLSSGGTIRYIQNISNTYKVQLISNSVSSTLFNRFKTPNDAALDILPGGSIILVWTSTNKQWRIAGGGPASTLLNTTLDGATLITGNLEVDGLTTLLGNTTFGTGPTLFIDNVNRRVGVKTASPAVPLSVNGNVTFLGTFTQSGATSFAGNTTFGGNTTITGILTLNTVGNTAVFGNTISVPSASLSVVKNLNANVFSVDSTASFATMSASVKGTFNRLVIPVGTNAWAT